jgi:cbb3-type cytochrome oxidase subunit 3
MFKQFTENISGNQAYLLFSLCIFLLFFIVVAIILIRIRKPHVDHMSQMPLNDNLIDQSKTLQK